MVPSTPEAPPRDLPNFDLSPAGIVEEAKAIVKRTDDLLDNLAATLSPTTATFANAVSPIIEEGKEARQRTRILCFMSSVSPNKDLRDASRDVEKILSEASAARLARTDIAALVSAVYDGHTSGKESLDAEDAHILKDVYLGYRQNGSAIRDPDQREHFLALKRELVDVLAAAKKAMAESDDGVWLTTEELEGLPARIVSKLKRSDEDPNKVFVTLQQADYTAVMQNAVCAATRKRMFLARSNRFLENVQRLRRVVELRHERARILGYENHAALKIDDLMSESVEWVCRLLDDVRTRLQPALVDEIAAVRRLKRMISTARTGVTDSASEEDLEVHCWDWGFFTRRLKEECYSVNLAKVSEYFEVMHTLEGMLSIFERLFGLRFCRETCQAWHEDVSLVSVWDSAEQGGGFLGHLYFDLFARTGKRSGAYHMSLEPAHADKDEKWHFPVSALICNFSKPTPSHPTLMQQREVQTMFHELGHAIHYLVGKTKHGMGFSRDFVEIPSVMLENWIWVPDVLVQLGKHYSYIREYKASWEGERPEEKLPRSLADGLARSRHLAGAYSMLFSIRYATYDLMLHTPADQDEASNRDYTRLWNQGLENDLGLAGYIDHETGTSATIGQAGFGHVFRAYDASYFAYPLAKICAADLYANTFAHDPMNPEIGKRYRTMFLQLGNSQPEAQTLRNFLGREANSEAYFRALGTHNNTHL